MSIILCRQLPRHVITLSRVSCVALPGNNQSALCKVSRDSHRYKSDVIVEPDNSSVKRPIMPAITLGLGGLIPFLGPPLFMINSGQFCDALFHGHLVYSAVILSFIGGVSWGYSINHDVVKPTWSNMVYSICPSIVSWLSIISLGPINAYYALGGGLALTAAVDILSKGYQPWFKFLRFVLTLGACTSIYLMINLKLDNAKNLSERSSLEDNNGSTPEP